MATTDGETAIDMPDTIELSPEESAFTLLLEELYPQPRSFAMNPNDLKNLSAALDEDEKIHQTMRGAAPGAAAQPNFSDAAKKALAAGFNMKQIITAFVGGYLSGGFAGGVAAVLALLVTPTP